MRPMKFEKIAGFLFILMIAGVFLGNLIAPDKAFSEDENRMLQERPVFSVSKYIEGRYETKTEDYINDQFVLRSPLIHLKTAVDRTFGKVESGGVYLCKDHYLMEDIASPSEQFDETKEALKNFRKKYASLNMYFLLAPNAANILSEKLPATVRTSDQDQLMDDFMKELDGSGYKSIDVRTAFRKNKDSVQIYYRTDHHWTTDGAYLAYQEACRTMGMKDAVTYTEYVVKNNFRGSLYSKSAFINGEDDTIKIYLPEQGQTILNSVIYYSDTKEKTTEFYELDNLKQKDAYSVFGGSNHPFFTVQTPTKDNKTLLLIKDSYANCMIPFLARQFRKIVVVDPRYYFESVEDLITSYEVTDVLFLYNANTFFQDDSLEMMLSD